MNEQLFPHLPFDEVETADSYVRRLSQFHTGRDGPSLLKDLGIDHRSFLSGSDDAIRELAAASGTSIGVLMTGTLQHKHRCRQFRNEICSVGFLRPEGALVCPECMKQDSSTGRAWMLKGHLAWRLRSLTTCLIHGVRLIEPTGFEDQAVFMGISNAEKLISMPQVPTDLELYIGNRLMGHPTGAGVWLDGQTIEQGAKACEMIGAAFLHGHKFSSSKLSAEDWRQAGAVGFDMAHRGADAVKEALTKIAAMSITTAGQAGAKAVYGSIYEWIGYGSQGVEFGPIRDLLRENILNTLVIEPDDVLLGERVVGRRLHSVYSLSIQTGLHRKRLRKILVQAGFASEESWDIAAHRLVFDANEAETLCRDIIDSVSLQLVPDVLNCSRSQAESLYREGVIVPVIPLDPERKIGKLAFVRQHLLELLNEVGSLPIAPDGNDDLIALVSAAKRTGLSTGNIMSRVLKGSLAACRVKTQASLNAVRFKASDLNPIRTRQPK